MFNNRMLAVAAVLAMAVPALGAATPIIVPPVPEQLVEGHTVFTVIEIARETNTNETRFAAAVAVLVREVQQEERNRRFPGVLWFNDQYLVNPVQSHAKNNNFRYPCGGAVMAVNAGDPDPRMVILRAAAGGTYSAAGDLPDELNGLGVGDYSQSRTVPTASATAPADRHTYTNPPWSKPYPGTYYYGQDGNPANDPDANSDYAWVGADAQDVSASHSGPEATAPSADPTTTPPTVSPGSVDQAPDAQVTGWQVYSDTVLTAQTGVDYQKSYLITDPNDHSWVIDVYKAYTRTAVTDDPATLGPDVSATEVYSWPVWVVNMLGSPVFVPDFGNSFENCSPFKNLLDSLPVRHSMCGVALPGANPISRGNDTDISLSQADDGTPPWTDDPCKGYDEPSDNNYCYGGQDPAQTGANCPDRSANPLRLYNAVLYFELKDLYVPDAPRDHSTTVSGGTNGCAEEPIWWGPQPPASEDWPCPAADNDEGNSHPFHPSTPNDHRTREQCLPAFYGDNPTNHGGSTYFPVSAPGSGPYTDQWGPETPCDYMHATRNIDVYFSPSGRPFPPVVRNFVVFDLEGSSAPFQAYHCAYEASCPDPELE